jgi:ABC-type antimicrobial peptide transport system permease subunit
VTLEELFARAAASERMTATLAGVMGGLAVVLAVIGIHGVLAFSVARRTREIGVRVAVGADPGMVARSVIRDASVLTVIGLAVGVPAALLATRLLRAMLFGISETDTLTFIAAVALFLVIGLLAGMLPARKAANVDPIMALRSE